MFLLNHFRKITVLNNQTNFSHTKFDINLVKLRSSPSQMFLKIGVLKNFAIFTGKHLCWGLFLLKLQAQGLQLYYKESPTQMFSCEYCETFKNSFFYKIPAVAAALNCWNFISLTLDHDLIFELAAKPFGNACKEFGDSAFANNSVVNSCNR